MHSDTDTQKEAPPCAAPDPHPAGPTRYRVPAGAVDTHCHVIGLPPSYPFVGNRSYTPPQAPLENYISMLDATGMTYGVLVQVSVHGTDNRVLVEALKAQPRRLRGIAVVQPDAPPTELDALKDAGVVGLRLNVLFGGGIGFDQMDWYGDLCRDMGWHLQFLLDARMLSDLKDKLLCLPVPFVIDHMGHMPVSGGIDHPGFQTLVRLIKDGAYVKLSGAFRTSADGPPYADTIPFARALNDAAPDRCLWGSDWPHVAMRAPMPKLEDLLNLMADWVPDEANRTRLFVTNPHRLYGFSA